MRFAVKLSFLFALVFAAANAAPSHASAQLLVMSGMGGKCLDVEGGSTTPGARVIGYACSGSWNQQFAIQQDGTIRFGSNCLDASGGAGRDGDQVVIWSCNGGANQKWSFSGDRLVGINGKCMDLSGGAGHWFGNQPVIIWSCNGGSNQKWYRAAVMPASRVSGAVAIQPGQLIDIRATAGARVVSGGGANVVSGGGANVVSAGGANVVSAGGANVISVGGGNVIMPVR